MEIVQEHSRCELSCYIKTFKKSDGMFHWHENYEICQVINKKCRFRIDGVIYTANIGDIITINRQTIHQFLIDEDNTDIRIIQFHPKCLLNISYCSSFLKPIITSSELDSFSNLSQTVNTLMQLIDIEHDEVFCNDNPYFQSLCCSLFFLLKRHFSTDSEVSVSLGQKRDFYKIVEYINLNFNEDISVNSIASHFYFSRGKLSTVFRKYSGIDEWN